MSNVRLFDKSFKPFIPNERLEEAIDKVAEKINHDFNGCTDCPVLLCVLNGSLMFTSELMKRLTFNCELVCIKLSSYNGTHTTGNVREVMGLTRSIEGKRVIVVEDIVDSGNTLFYLGKYLMGRGASSIRIATLLDKPDRRNPEHNLTVDYHCFKIPDEFVVGYGLDFAEKYRNLPDIGVLDSRVYGAARE